MPLPLFSFLKSVILTLPLTHTLIPFPHLLGLFLEATGSSLCSLTLHLGLSIFLSSSPSLSAAVEQLRASSCFFSPLFFFAYYFTCPRTATDGGGEHAADMRVGEERNREQQQQQRNRFASSQQKRTTTAAAAPAP